RARRKRVGVRRPRDRLRAEPPCRCGSSGSCARGTATRGSCNARRGASGYGAPSAAAKRRGGRSADLRYTTGELMPPTDVQEPEVREVPFGGSMLEQQTRGEIDIQIVTARRFPRSIRAFRDRAMEMATLTEDIAE